MLQRQQRETHARRAGNGRPWVPLVLAALLLSSIGVSAQEQALTVTLAGFGADDWPQAQAVVTVLDNDDRPVAGLAQAHFQAQLNDSPVPLVAVTQGVDSSLPIAVVLALDVSGSMEGGVLEQAKVAARRFLEGLGPEDEVAVLTFGDTVNLVQPFTQDRGAAGTGIDGLTASGATALYQATAESVRLAAAADSSRRAVVLLSDGLDHGSALLRGDALTTAETLGVPVFVIGLGADIDRGFLQELARLSGGQFAETPSPEGLSQLYQDAGELLRGQYILTLDASGLALVQSEAATFRVGVTVGERTGGGERVVCPQSICVTLSEVEQGERLEEERTVSAEVLSADPVVSVTFLVDGEPVQQLTEPPYQFTFEPATFADGEHALDVEVATASEEARAGEVAVLTGAKGGGFASSYLLAVAGILIAAVAAAVIILLWRRRRGGAGEEPGPALRPEPPAQVGGTTPATSDAPGAAGPGRPLWSGEPAPPPAVPQEPLGRLLVASGSMAGETFPVGDVPVSIGSGEPCLVRLSDEVEGAGEIAPEHARVWVRDGQLMVHELRRLTPAGSAGGRWQILTPGDVFTIGSCTFRFELAAEEAAARTDREVPNILRGSADKPDDPAPHGASDSPEAPALGEEQSDPPAAEGSGSPSTAPKVPGSSPTQGEE